MDSVKRWRRLEFDVPSALEVTDGVECLAVAAVAGSNASGSGGGSVAGVPSGPSLKFSLEQTGNMDENPVWCESAGRITVAGVGQKEVAVKPDGKEKTRITSVLTVFADGAQRTRLPGDPFAGGASAVDQQVVGRLDRGRRPLKKAGLLLPFDGSTFEASANKELGSDAWGGRLDFAAPAADEDNADSPTGGANFLGVLEIVDDDDTGWTPAMARE
eukprot:jgi/Undpi1/5031/HiC_scaffold_19.g08383.m1